MPNAGVPAARGGPQHLLCSPEYMAQYARRLLWAGVQDRRRLLRHHARAHQADPLRGALAAARPRRPLPSRWRSPKPRRRRMRQGAGGGEVASSAPSSPRASSSPSSRSCRRAAWTPPGRSPARRLCARARHRLHQRARRPARQRPHERAGHLPAHPAAGRHRGGAPLLLPRPQHPRHPVRTAGRPRRRASAT